MPNINTNFKSYPGSLRAKKEIKAKELAEIDPNSVPSRLCIIFDDSGSMMGESIQNAREAVKQFTLQCNPFDTSLGITPLNKEKQPLTCDYDLLNLYVSGIMATGGTPLYTKMLSALKSENVTRLVVFSDGGSTDTAAEWNWEGNEKLESPKDQWLSYIKSECGGQPHDTVYIGYDTDSGYTEMKWIAEMTGGIFIHFKDTLSLTSGLKYLSPGMRGLLMNPEIKERIQRGEKV